jgi:ankyrin repeat protein
VKLLLDGGANIDIKDDDWPYRMTPLMYACDNGQAEIVRLLLDRGASRKSKDSVGQTALDIAKKSGRTEIVALFKSRPH